MLINKSTPLHLAVREATDYNICRLLVDNGADIGSSNLESQTPLHTYFNRVLSRLILSNSSSIEADLQDSRGMTIAHYTAWTKLSTPADITPFLGDREVLLNSKDIYGRTVLHLAAQRGNVALVEELLKLKDWSASQVRDNAGRTPLHYSTENTRVRVLHILRASGMDLDDADIYGRNALLHSAARGTLAATKYLLARADDQQLARKDCKGRSILRLACEYKNREVAEYLQATLGMNLARESQKIRKSNSRLYFSSVKLGLLGLGLTVIVARPALAIVLLLCCWIRVQYGILETLLGIMKLASWLMA